MLKLSEGDRDWYRDEVDMGGLRFNLCVAPCNDCRPYLQSVDSEVGIGSGPGWNQIGSESEDECGGETEG